MIVLETNTAKTLLTQVPRVNPFSSPLARCGSLPLYSVWPCSRYDLVSSDRIFFAVFPPHLRTPVPPVLMAGVFALAGRPHFPLFTLVEAREKFSVAVRATTSFDTLFLLSSLLIGSVPWEGLPQVKEILSLCPDTSSFFRRFFLVLSFFYLRYVLKLTQLGPPQGTRPP